VKLALLVCGPFLMGAAALANLVCPWWTANARRACQEHTKRPSQTPLLAYPAPLPLLLSVVMSAVSPALARLDTPSHTMVLAFK